MWISPSSCARKDVVTMATPLGRVSAPSAGGKSTTKQGRSRFRRTGNWQSGKRTKGGRLTGKRPLSESAFLSSGELSARRLNAKRNEYFYPFLLSQYLMNSFE